ncbi:MAG: signal recognition particle protein [Armatimonadetes bacterium]|nr:signal recognition particle protein [Armatimonadota bacterium]
MFDSLTSRLQGVFDRLRGRGALTEKDVDEALKEVRRALLEADVNFKVVKEFVTHVREKAVGQDVLESLSAAQQVVKFVRDEMVALLGQSDPRLKGADSPPSVILLAGLNGAGKTTTAGKLALRMKSEGKRPLLVAADIHRPAAAKQLATLAEQVGVPVHTPLSSDTAVGVARDGVALARRESLDPVIVDLAGRQHADEDLMRELAEVSRATSPSEVLLVLDAMTGQDAVNTALEFGRHVPITGFVLTKMDADARGGAAISIRQVTGHPIKFVGISEKMDGLEPFHPDRMAGRILGMGDVLTLVEKAEQAFNAEQAKELEAKFLKDDFGFDDYLEQIGRMRKMGPLDQIMGMIPGFGKIKDLAGEVNESELDRVTAIINSMTREERRSPDMINGSRRRRIAIGSGSNVQDVNRLLRQFSDMRRMMRQFANIEHNPKAQKRLMNMPFLR